MIEDAWPLISSALSPLLVRGVIPDSGVTVTLRGGSAGYLLLDFALWYHENIEPINGKTVDDWGWSYRENKNNPGVWSRHARGIAIDLDAIKHPNGKTGTYTLIQ